MGTSALVDLMDRVEQSEEAKHTDTPVKRWIKEATQCILDIDNELGRLQEKLRSL